VRSYRFRAVFTILLVAVVVPILGCPTHTSIADINRDPGHFAGKEVTIAGNVADSFGALGNGVFQMDDGSARIWVYSQNFGVPGNGQKVAITGRVEQGFAFGGRNFGVVLRQTKARN